MHHDSAEKNPLLLRIRKSSDTFVLRCYHLNDGHRKEVYLKFLLKGDQLITVDDSRVEQSAQEVKCLDCKSADGSISWAGRGWVRATD